MAIKGKEQIEMPECTRCGLCCLSASCGFHDYEENCTELEFDGEIAVCKAIEDGRMPPELVCLGKGCFIRLNDIVFDMYNDMYMERKEFFPQRRRDVYTKS